MSQEKVGVVNGALLTDEELRVRFALNRIDALLELSAQGVVLTEEEIELFVKTDLHLWSWDHSATSRWVH